MNLKISCAFFLLALTAMAQDGHVHTSREGARILPLPKGDDVWHFVIYGDRTSGRPEGLKYLRQAVDDTNLLDPDLTMTVGDLIQGYNAQEAWLAEMREYREIMDRLRRPWYPVPGNHDIYWRGDGRPANEHEGNYEEHFGPLWYWFRHKDAAFIVLYSDEGDPATSQRQFGKTDKFSDKQLAWLKKTLEEAKSQRHAFVFLHHPRWITAKYPDSNWEEVHRLLVAAGNVRVVFAGHIHQMRYDGKRDGIEYFTLAATGASIKFDSPQAGLLHEFNVVTVRPEGYNIAALPVGAVIDPRQFTPERIEDIDRLYGIEVPKVVQPLELSVKDGDVKGTYHVRIVNPAQRPVEATLTLNLPDASWSAAPDHAHLLLEPGVATDVKFFCERHGKSFGPGSKLPSLVANLEWLGPDVRVTMPEKSWPVAVRISARGHDAADAKSGLLLDGKNDALVLESEDCVPPDGPFTIETWMSAREIGGRRPLISKAEQSEFGLFFSGGKASFSVFLGEKYVTVESPTALIEKDRWHHVAGVFDGDSVRLFVDGRLVAEAPGKGVRRRNKHPVYVGADTNGQGKPVDFMTGRIDEVRISNSARYRENFVPDRALTSDAASILMLHCDEQVGELTLDASPHAAHGRLLGGLSVGSLEESR